MGHPKTVRAEFRWRCYVVVYLHHAAQTKLNLPVEGAGVASAKNKTTINVNSIMGEPVTPSVKYETRLRIKIHSSA